MSIMASQLICLRGDEKEVGRGLYRSVLRVGDYVLKIHSCEGDAKELARKIVEKNLELRKKLDFLPEFYGAVVTGLRSGNSLKMVVVSLHEYVEPVKITRVSITRIAQLVERAARAGFVLDMKLSNFGEKDGKIYYLDEGGIGKGPIPPDVEEEWRKFLKNLINRMKIKR